MSEGKITLESMSGAVWYNRWTIRQFQPFLKGDILEVGCGIGNFTQILTTYGNVWAIDIENNYINSAKKKAKNARVGPGNIATGKYFFKNHFFDTIVCLNVLEHIKEDDKALSNIYKLLKKNGYLVLLVPTHKFLYGKIDQAINHFRRYDKQELKEKLSVMGLDIIKSKRLNLLGGLGWWFVGKILKDKEVKGSRI